VERIFLDVFNESSTGVLLKQWMVEFKRVCKRFEEFKEFNRAELSKDQRGSMLKQWIGELLKDC
jgi:hypothetical protein